MGLLHSCFDRFQLIHLAHFKAVSPLKNGQGQVLKPNLEGTSTSTAWKFEGKTHHPQLLACLGLGLPSSPGSGVTSRWDPLGSKEVKKTSCRLRYADSHIIVIFHHMNHMYLKKESTAKVLPCSQFLERIRLLRKLFLLPFEFF